MTSSWIGRRRPPLSGRRGRLGPPATVVLRMLLLKHLRNWSVEECERDVRGRLVYRAFARNDGERVPEAQTLPTHASATNTAAPTATLAGRMSLL